MTEHRLKTLPMFFDAVIEGHKTFEIRLDDRNFKVGDVLHLVEWDGSRETGREHRCRVTYITNLVGMQPGYVALAIAALAAQGDAESVRFRLEAETRRLYEQVQSLRAERDALAAQGAEPDPALINSMAMRYRHDFGLLDEQRKEAIRVTMRQLWEEVVGLGFYRAAAPQPKEQT